ncbi:MAG: DUF4230 domain-containing protein [Acidimicrobiales bacterium]
MAVLTPERERAARLAPPPARRRRSPLVVAVVAVLAFLGADRLFDFLPSWPNPFATETVDRTGPAVLRAVEDLSRYQAATGNFQVIVDLEKDARFMPDFIRGERTLFVGAGTVDAWVDFTGIGSGAITVSPDGDEVTVVLPHAQLSGARLDTGASRVVVRERGLLDRLGSVFSDSPTGERQLYLLAEEKLEAAAREAGVAARAEANTRAMLESMLGSLGFEKVNVVFGDPAA